MGEPSADLTEQTSSPDWAKYYDSKILHFGQSENDYEKAMRDLSEGSNLLDPNSPKTFLLGGFVPFNGTPESFEKFCKKMHPNPQDKHIYLDINSQPFANPTARPGVQASLENLPFKENSVDFIFLDGTVDFMSDEAVRGFAQNAARVLSPRGLILMVKSDPKETRFIQEKLPSVSRFPRTNKEIVSLLTSGSQIEQVLQREQVMPHGVVPPNEPSGIPSLDERSPLFNFQVLAFSQKGAKFEPIGMPPKPSILDRITGQKPITKRW